MLQGASVDLQDRNEGGDCSQPGVVQCQPVDIHLKFSVSGCGQAAMLSSLNNMGARLAIYWFMSAVSCYWQWQVALLRCPYGMLGAGAAPGGGMDRGMLPLILWTSCMLIVLAYLACTQAMMVV